jgi:hypothetical protein
MLRLCATLPLSLCSKGPSKPGRHKDIISFRASNGVVVEPIAKRDMPADLLREIGGQRRVKYYEVV